jgi:glycosyltransferase involved in cell wall biosynthesis
MTDDCRRPLVTFYVIAYNQARFVREAVEGALAQTYSPTEIVLSDDCSTDGTFEIIQEVVKGYAGPHKVILNRNNRNLGLSEHLNRIMELATGELIVASDGDDVSNPQRTERCVKAWLRNGKPGALFSSVSCIDAAGNPSKTKNGDQWFAQFLPAANETPSARLVRFSKQGSPRLVTCSAAWTKELFDAFGPLPAGLWFEDDVMTLRALLFDRIVFVQEATVLYREHESNLFNRIKHPLTTLHARRDAEQATRIYAQRRKETLLGYLPDVSLASRQKWITRPLSEELKRRVETESRFHQIVEDWWNVSWIRRLALFFFLVRSGRMREVRWGGPRLLPLPLFLGLGVIWSRVSVIRFVAWNVLSVACAAVQVDRMDVLTCA